MGVLAVVLVTVLFIFLVMFLAFGFYDSFDRWKYARKRAKVISELNSRTITAISMAEIEDNCKYDAQLVADVEEVFENSSLRYIKW